MTDIKLYIFFIIIKSLEKIDPMFNEQWYIEKLKIKTLWDRVEKASIKKDIKIAILDSGFNCTHEELLGRCTLSENDNLRNGGSNRYNGTDFVDSMTGRPMILDNLSYSLDECKKNNKACISHGTMVAGIIGAKYKNGKGLSGILGPHKATLLNVRIMGDEVINSTIDFKTSNISSGHKDKKTDNTTRNLNEVINIRSQTRQSFQNKINMNKVVENKGYIKKALRRIQRDENRAALNKIEIQSLYHNPYYIDESLNNDTFNESDYIAERHESYKNYNNVSNNLLSKNNIPNIENDDYFPERGLNIKNLIPTKVVNFIAQPIINYIRRNLALRVDDEDNNRKYFHMIKKNIRILNFFFKEKTPSFNQADSQKKILPQSLNKDPSALGIKYKSNEFNISGSKSMVEKRKQSIRKNIIKTVKIKINNMLKNNRILVESDDKEKSLSQNKKKEKSTSESKKKKSKNGDDNELDDGLDQIAEVNNELDGILDQIVEEDFGLDGGLDQIAEEDFGLDGGLDQIAEEDIENNKILQQNEENAANDNDVLDIDSTIKQKNITNDSFPEIGTSRNKNQMKKRSGGSTASFLSGLDYALSNKVHLINLSVTILPYFSSVRYSNSAGYTYIPGGRWLERFNDTVLVIASGNEGFNLERTSALIPRTRIYRTNIVLVGSTDKNDNLSPFSNYGKRLVDITAPGEDIVGPCDLSKIGSSIVEYCKSDGTSFATPIITGIIALLMLLNKHTDARLALHCIRKTAKRKDNILYGMIDVIAAADYCTNSTESIKNTWKSYIFLITFSILIAISLIIVRLVTNKHFIKPVLKS